MATQGGSQGKEGRLDRFFRAMAEECADGTTRRSLLVGLGTGLAAFFGIKFAAPSFGQILSGVPVAALGAQELPWPCSHDAGCGATALGCGMIAAVDCAKYRFLSNGGGSATSPCKDCFDPDPENPCPKGAVKRNNWIACCRCKETPADSTRGTYIEYWDCCAARRGKNYDLHRDCLSKDCKANVKNSGCSANTGDCDLEADDGAGNAIPNYVEWCGIGLGSPACTYAVDTRMPCSKS